MKKSSIRIRVSQSGGMMMRENSGTNLRFSLRGTRKGTKESIIEMVDQTKILRMEWIVAKESIAWLFRIAQRKWPRVKFTKEV